MDRVSTTEFERVKIMTLWKDKNINSEYIEGFISEYKDLSKECDDLKFEIEKTEKHYQDSRVFNDDGTVTVNESLYEKVFQLDNKLYDKKLELARLEDFIDGLITVGEQRGAL